MRQIVARQAGGARGVGLGYVTSRGPVCYPVIAKGESSMRRVLLGCSSATLFAATLALNSSPSLAQSEEVGALWGTGAERRCNVVMDSDREPVVQTPGDAPGIQL